MRDCVTNLRAVVMGAALLAGHCVRIEPAPQQQACRRCGGILSAGPQLRGHGRAGRL
jgi:hypothetical protein